MPDPLTDRLWALSQRWREIASTKADDLHPGYCLALKNCAAEVDAEIARVEAEQPPLLNAVKCKARATADPPQDCDWPVCGCDPYADRVIAALEESGRLAIPVPGRREAEPQRDPAYDVCARCGHYRSTHRINTCEGWMPAGTGHNEQFCRCTGFVPRESVPPPTPDGAPRPEGTMKTAFMAGWHAGFQEALLEDRHPDQDRAEVAWCEFLVDCNTDGFQSEG